MPTDWNAHPDSASPPSRPGKVPARRRFGRLRQDTLYCNLGEVVDICVDGIRIVGPRKLAKNRPYEIRLRSFTLPGPLWGVVVWTRRLGFFRHEIGIKFEHSDPQVIRRLTAIAGCGGLRRLTGKNLSDAA